MPSPTVDPALSAGAAGASGRPRRRLAGLTARLAPQAPPMRARVALALAAGLAGLGLASAVLIHPVDRTPTTVPPGDVALVNGAPILTNDFMIEVEAVEGQPFADVAPAVRSKILHEMIDEELMVQRALALDLPEQDTGVRSSLVSGVNALVTAPIQGQPPTDDELRAYYAAHRANYGTKGSMTLSDLVLHVGGSGAGPQSIGQALADAAQAAYELRSGAAVDTVEQHFGMAESGKVSGAEQDFAAKSHLGPKLYAVAETLSDGQVSEPVADADGVHVLVMQHREAPIFTDYDAVRNNVYADYALARQTPAEQANLRLLRSKAKIVLAPGQIE